MNSLKTAAPYLAVSALCVVSIAWVLCDFFAMRQKPDFIVSAEAVPEYDVSELANAALHAEIVVPHAEFAPKAGSPFKVFGVGAAVGAAAGGVGAVVKSQRLPFILRGLMRDPPLAILEDARGETYIRARGDFIQNAQIITINSNSVVFKDSSGTHELTVEESK